MTKLNIGGGNAKLDGFVNIDRKNGSEAYPLQHVDDSVDEIRASHILEHFNYGDAVKVLADWVRVLKPGALIQIAVPDFDKIAQAKKDGDANWRFYAAGGQMDANDIHASVWDESILSALMQQVGLKEIKAWDGDKRDTSGHKVSLNLQGRKPATGAVASSGVPAGKRRAKITAVLSCPRVGWNDFWGEAISALSPLGIPLRRFMGAFWDQCMQNALEDMIAEDNDFIVTLDYDSIILAKDVERLLEQIIGNDDIDAISSLQLQRSSQKLMLTGAKTEKNPLGSDRAINITEGKPFKVKTAHFGLTVLRVDALRDLPKPWFLHVPDSKGGYRGDDRVDADIYFWHKWAANDRTLYVDPQVNPGHLEVVVSEFDEDLKPRYLSVKEWRANQEKKQ